MNNTLYFGDNLDIIREFIHDETIDLIYLDPPFNSKSNYNVIFKTKNKEDAPSQIQAFEDTWKWNSTTEFELHQLFGAEPKLAELMKGLELIIGKNDLLAYLVMMAIRLRELYRVLKDTGSLYLHCDPTASHYLKLILDSLFGMGNFRNEVIWKRTFAHNDPKRFGAIHDTLLFYSKSDEYVWNTEYLPYDQSYIDNFFKYKDKHGRYRVVILTAPGVTKTGNSGKKWKNKDPTKIGRHWAVPRKTSLPSWTVYPDNWDTLTTQEKLDVLDNQGLIYWPKKKDGSPGVKRYLGESSGTLFQDIIDDVPPLSAQSKEKMGYPTQKPIALLERIIKASSNEGDVILDPFCGCGTAIVAAQRLNRHWIGMDITHLAIGLMEKRIYDEFKIKPKVIGAPASFIGAENLFKRSPLDFERWAVTRIDGMHPNDKQVGDHGIDGRGYIGPDHQYKTIISVKGGKNLTPSMVNELIGVVARDNAAFGVLITIHNPTDGMKKEAAKAGIVETPLGHHYPKIQIYTISDYFNGKKAELP